MPRFGNQMGAGADAASRLLEARKIQYRRHGILEKDIPDGEWPAC
jgi:hypothetical protein